MRLSDEWRQPRRGDWLLHYAAINFVRCCLAAKRFSCQLISVPHAGQLRLYRGRLCLFDGQIPLEFCRLGLTGLSKVIVFCECAVKGRKAERISVS